MNKKDYHIDKEQPKRKTLNPWSHAPADDPKRPTKQPSNNRKNHKMKKKTLFLRHTRVLVLIGHVSYTG